jgi:DNA repair photolyase
MTTLSLPARGTAHNPANRFTALAVVRDAWDHPDDPAAATRLWRDDSRSIISRNTSPDIWFEVSLNPYRGCEHGCVYCYARPYHEYLGFSAGLDFETQIMVKEDAPHLLRAALYAPSWKPQPLALSGVTDPYQPVERRLKITRRCLAVLAEFRQPVAVITKSHLVTRDLDELGALAEHGAAAVTLSITTLDRELQRRLEPRASTPERRLEAIAKLAGAGIPVGVSVAPVIPGLTEHEIPQILEAAARAGANWAGYLMLRLPYGVADLFADWLARHYPDRRDKVLSRVRAVRGGRLNDPRFGSRLRGEGVHARQMAQLFEVACRRVGLDAARPALSAAAFRRPARGVQLPLFG